MATPPPPPGFDIVQPQSVVPPPPPGFDLVEDPRAKADADVRAGANTPDYRGGGLFGDTGARLQRFSDMITDPLGLQDELVGAGQAIREYVTGARAKATGNPSIWESAGDAYTEAAERVRAERRVAREDNGWGGTAAEVVGGFGTAGLSKAATPVVNGLLRNAWNTAKVGGTYGAVAGTSQGEGGVGNRLLSGLEGGLYGGLLAPAVANVAVPFIGRTVGAAKDAYRYTQGAVRSARDPQQAAVENFADRMVAAKADPAALRAQVAPKMSSNLQGRNFSEEDLADIVSRGLRGEPPASIGQQYGLNPNTVKNYVAKYRADNPTDMNIADLVTEAQGPGGAAPILRLGRAAHSLAGDESGDAAKRLMDRQETQAGRVSNIIDRSVAGGDFEATRTAGLKNLKDEAGKAYKAFYAEAELATNQLADLLEDPLFRRATIQAQRQARVDTIARNQQAARSGGQQEPVPTVSADNEVFTPQMLDNIQRQLRIAGEGAVSNPNAARHAQNLREVFLDRIEDHYPTFRGIRKNYATGMGEFGEEGALEAGAALTARLGAPAREALRGFDTMTPAQQELFRLGFARKLKDDAANKQIGGAVANQFNSPAVREIVATLYPKTDKALHAKGQKLIRDLHRETITTNTKNELLKGARTAELGSDMSRMQEGVKTAADALTGRPWKMIENLTTRLTTQLGRKGAKEVLELLTTTEPAELLNVLNRLARAANTTQQRQTYVAAIRQLRNSGAIGAAAGTGVTAGRE